MNWIAVLVVLGALGFIALKVFDRPDPRKRKLEQNSAAEGAPAEGVSAEGAAQGSPGEPPAEPSTP
jgi:hypothetical protein